MRKDRFYTSKTFIVAVIIILLIFLSLAGALRPVQVVIFELIEPIARGFLLAGNFGRQAGDALKTAKGQLIAENEALRQEINALLAQKAELEQLRDENKSLREIVGFSQKDEHDYIIAKIIAREPNHEFEAVIINQGQDAGILKNQAVLSPGGIVIGKIYQVQNNYATVLLLTDNQAKLAVKILATERSLGLLEGSFGLVAQVNLIPKDEPINIGDLVVTSGTEENIPAGLVVGQVEEIFEQPDQLFKSAKIKQNVQYDQLDLVNIIIFSP